MLFPSNIYNDIVNVNIVNVGDAQSLFSIIVTSKQNLTPTNLPPSQDYYEHERPISSAGRILYTVPVSTGESVWIYSDSDSLAIRADSKFVATPPPNTTYASGADDVQW